MKKVILDLTTLDSNAFSLLGEFQRAARRAGWTSEEIQRVVDEAKRVEIMIILSLRC